MDWNWSFRAFRLFGTDVRIHWSLPAFFLYYIMRGANFGYTPTIIGLFVVLPMLLLFFSVICHEFGHVFAARHFGQRTDYMILTPIGGMVMVAQGRSPWAEFVVAFAGPAVNLGLAAVGAALYFAVGGPASLDLISPFTADRLVGELWAGGRLAPMVLTDFVRTNIILFAFNMAMVAYPLDGGRVLMAALWKKRGFHPALVLSCKIGRVAGVVLGIVGLFTASFGLVLIGIFVFVQAANTLKQAAYLPDPSGGYRSAPRRPAKQTPGPLARWRAAQREKKIRSLLAKAELKGIDALTAAERDFLKRARELN